MLCLEIITPDCTAYEGDALSVTLPTADGEITVLPGHIPLIGVVIPGTMIVRGPAGREEMFAVSRGVLEVSGDGVRILADTADRADELQEEEIARAKEAAEKLVAERRGDTEGFAEANAILGRELARLHTVRRHRSRAGTGPAQQQQQQ